MQRPDTLSAPRAQIDATEELIGALLPIAWNLNEANLSLLAGKLLRLKKQFDRLRLDFVPSYTPTKSRRGNRSPRLALHTPPPGGRREAIPAGFRDIEHDPRQLEIF
jgi:hypothetical protein